MHLSNDPERLYILIVGISSAGVWCKHCKH